MQRSEPDHRRPKSKRQLGLSRSETTNTSGPRTTRLRSLSLSLSLSPSLSLYVLMSIFPSEHGLAGFIAAKDDGSGGDNWSYISRAN